MPDMSSSDNIYTGICAILEVVTVWLRLEFYKNNYWTLINAEKTD